MGRLAGTLLAAVAVAVAAEAAAGRRRQRQASVEGSGAAAAGATSFLVTSLVSSFQPLLLRTPLASCCLPARPSPPSSALRTLAAVLCSHRPPCECSYWSHTMQREKAARARPAPQQQVQPARVVQPFSIASHSPTRAERGALMHRLWPEHCATLRTWPSALKQRFEALWLTLPLGAGSCRAGRQAAAAPAAIDDQGAADR